jgi:hypothetical protein
MARPVGAPAGAPTERLAGLASRRDARLQGDLGKKAEDKSDIWREAIP